MRLFRRCAHCGEQALEAMIPFMHEGHLEILAVDFNQSHNAAQLYGIVLLRLLAAQFDDFIAQDAFVFRGFERTHLRVTKKMGG